MRRVSCSFVPHFVTSGLHGAPMVKVKHKFIRQSVAVNDIKSKNACGVSVGMSSAKATRSVKWPGYLPMTSLDDSSSHQRDAADSSSGHDRPPTEFRMIPGEADCQVRLGCISHILMGR